MNGMGIIATLIFGALVGWIASMIMKTDGGMGAIANIIVGIVGSFLGGWVASMLGIGGTPNGFNIGSILIGILGACLLIFLVQLLTGKRR